MKDRESRVKNQEPRIEIRPARPRQSSLFLTTDHKPLAEAHFTELLDSYSCHMQNLGVDDQSIGSITDRMKQRYVNASRTERAMMLDSLGVVARARAEAKGDGLSVSQQQENLIEIPMPETIQELTPEIPIYLGDGQ